MSLTTASTSNLRLILDALNDYTKQTGIDLSKNPFAESFLNYNSPDSVLQLLQDRAKAFKDYRDGNRKLINWLSPVVQVLHAFSGILGEVASLVSPPGIGFVLADRILTPLPGAIPAHKINLCRHRCTPHGTTSSSLFSIYHF